MKHKLTLWETAAAAFIVLILAFSVLGAGSPDGFAQVPYDSQSATAVVANGDSLSGAVTITGAKRVGIHVPTLTSAALNIQASCTLAGTYTGLWHSSDESEFEIGAGTGLFSIDVTDIVTGFDFIRIRLGAAQGAERTFTIIIKY